jgi:hypothetical protein
MEGCVSYCYETERANLFTEDGVQTLTAIRDKARELLRKAGAFSAGRAMDDATGDSWTMLAALDYLVEKGEIVRVTAKDSTWGQHQIFTSRDRYP